ncbi:MAG: ribosome silencing factor [Gemmatimonadota bacterium]
MTPGDKDRSPIDPAASLLDREPRLRLIVEILQSRKGLDIAVMDLRRVTDAADYFVLCTGNSDVHVHALSQDLVERLTQSGERPWHVEGAETRRWVLVDLVDIVIHLLRREAREFYALERLWGDAEIYHFADAWDEPVGDAGAVGAWMPDRVRG